MWKKKGQLAICCPARLSVATVKVHFHPWPSVWGVTVSDRRLAKGRTHVGAGIKWWSLNFLLTRCITTILGVCVCQWCYKRQNYMTNVTIPVIVKICMFSSVFISVKHVEATQNCVPCLAWHSRELQSLCSVSARRLDSCIILDSKTRKGNREGEEIMK